MVATHRSVFTPASIVRDAVGETSPSAGRSPATVPTSSGALHLHTYLDASRAQALEHLFDISGQQGMKVFSRLLSCQLPIPDDASSSKPDETVDNAPAMMSVESLHIFPTSLSIPPSTLLADLDALLARQALRPKVKTLVRQVRDRCITHEYISAETLGLEE